MKVNFIGGFFPKDKLKEYQENTLGIFQYAADSLQKSIIAGLQLNNITTELITVPFLENYPNYKKLFIKREKTSSYNSIPFINLKVLDSISKSYHLRQTIKKEIKNDKEEIILIYGMFDYFFKSIPKKQKNKICLIVPDLPSMMGGDLRKFHIKLYLKFIENTIKKNLYKIDCFVLISEKMKDVFDIKNKPWVVVEGIYNNQDQIAPQKKEAHTTILYTGTLAKRYGILDLLEAFRTITDETFVLWICGDGDGKEEIENAAKSDVRIKYLGQIPNEQVQVLQRKATVLINPRKNDSEFTKYSFPSKTMEYFASGTPTIMHRLEGIPEEYFQFCFCPSEQNANGLKEKIIEVSNLTPSERENFGKQAQEFIFNKKNPKIQTEKIIEMLKKI